MYFIISIISAVYYSMHRPVAAAVSQASTPDELVLSRSAGPSVLIS
jgi:hypothetical protein